MPVGASVGLSRVGGEDVIRVVKPEENTEPDVATYARLVGLDFHDGAIEVDVRARLMPWADVDCRGFIGIVFRANADDTAFEGFYVRPRNGRSCTEDPSALARVSSKTWGVAGRGRHASPARPSSNIPARMSANSSTSRLARSRGQ